MASLEADNQAFAVALRRELAQAGFLKKSTSVHQRWDPAVGSLDIRRAAAEAGVVHFATVWNWTRGQTVPGRGPSDDPRLFWKFIEKLRLDPRPFVGIPATRQEKRIRRICVDCGDIRRVQPWRARKLDNVDWEHREARGRCKRCSGRNMMRTSKALRQKSSHVRADEWRKHLGYVIRRVRQRRTAEDQRVAARAPRPKWSIQALLKGSRRRPISLCPLCGLIVEQPVERRSWVSESWHQPCLQTWIDHSGQRRAQFAARPPKFILPPVPAKRGRPFVTKHLGRNLILFLRYQAHKLGYPGGRSMRESAKEAKIRLMALQEQFKSVVRLLPGDWKLVYRLLTAGGNRSLQRLFQLPERLKDLNQRGERDGLVRRLCDHQMPLEQVSRITGMPLPQILALLKERAQAGDSGGLRRA